MVIQEGSEHHPLSWTDGEPSDDRFSRVFVFDADCADHYIDESDGTAFTPFGLDILEKLSGASDALKQRLIKRKQTIAARIDAIKGEWRVQANTAVGKLIAGLSASTSHVEVEKLAVWTQADASRLDHINQTLTSNPKLKAQNSRAAASRITEFAAAIRKAAALLQDSNIRQLCEAIAESEQAAQVAAAFAGARFDASYLNGTGGKLWSHLWAAAREFSVTDAYPSVEFPNVADDSRCVLCQSNLDENARERMRRFDEFISNQASVAFDAARNNLTALKAKLLDFDRISDAWKRAESDLSFCDADQLEAFAAFASACDRRHEAIKAAMTTGEWNSLPVLTVSPEVRLIELAGALLKRASDEEAAADPSQHQRLAMRKRNSKPADGWRKLLKVLPD